MAHLWVRDQEHEWAVLSLESDAYTLTAELPAPVAKPRRDGAVLSDVLLLKSGAALSSTWVLISSSNARVSINGMPLTIGIRALADRDEIRIGGRALYFSSEGLARVEEFPGADRALFCPRCKQEIEKGKTAVKCPACDRWHHQIDELNCWTYAETCALCNQETDLNAGFKWTPEEL